jgi:hypothetical protein
VREPQHLVRTLILGNLHLSDVQVFTTIPLRTYADFGGEAGPGSATLVLRVARAVRTLFSGKTDHIPLSSDMLERMIRDGAIRINTASSSSAHPMDMDS